MTIPAAHRRPVRGSLTRLRRRSGAARVRPTHNVRSRTVLVVLVGGAALVLAMILAMGCGPVTIPPLRVVGALLQASGAEGSATATERAVVLSLRLPRVLVGALVGMALSCAGVAMQGTFRNPLAEPGVVGVSAGGALGAVTALYFGLSHLGSWTVPAAAFAGSLVALAAVFAISARAQRGTGATTMLLVGIGINALLGAVISIMITTARNEQELRSITFWLQGSLDARTWSHVVASALPILIGCALLLSGGRELNVMALGDDQGRSSGVDVRATRALILVVAALITAMAVAVSGTISFVGLVVPHILRLVLGPDHRVLLPAAAFGGATFLVLADVAARMLVNPISLQVGIITALLGAPVLLISVTRGKGVGQ